MRRLAPLLFAGCIGVSGTVNADSFGFFRYDDDVADLASATSGLERLKYIPLAEGGSSYASLGAELRERVEHYDHGYLGLAHDPATTYELHRTLIQVDVHLTNLLDGDIRGFAQAGSEGESGRRPASVPTDVDHGDLQQAFIDYSTSFGSGRATVRAGRFEMALGSGMLVAPRDGTNIRLAWDGVRAFYTASNWRVDALVVRPVTDHPGYFDDAPSQGQSLWGIYIAGHPGLLAHYAADLYTFGSINHTVRLARGTGAERLSTTGVRLYGNIGALDTASEAILQTGRFNDSQVLAYATTQEIGWTFKKGSWTPRVALRGIVASGGTNSGNGRVGTFNALYPNVAQGTEAVIEAPANLIEAGVKLGAAPTKSIDLEYVGQSVWRYSTKDAFYASPLFPLGRADTSGKRYVGIEQQVAANWRIDHYFTLRCAVAHFLTGDYIDRLGGRDTLFAMTYLQLRV